jgi:probable rRNA maturation factor
MTIEVTNTSGQLVPTAEMTSLMTHAMTALDLNPDCDLNIAFVEDDYMSQEQPMFCPFQWICLKNLVKR